MRRALLSLALFFALGPRVAGAQDDPRRAQAAPFFDEGRRLAEKNQNAESLDRFRKAYAIFGSPNTLFNVARQEQLLGQRLAALRDYRDALRNPVLLYQFASQARTYVAELETVTGRLQVVGPDGTQVTVAGSAYKLPLAMPIDVEPGTVQVVGMHGTERFETVAEAKAGATVTATLVPVTTATTPATSLVEPPQEPPHAEPSPARWLVPAGLGAVGVTGIVLGVVFLSKGNTANDEAKVLAVRCLGVTSTACDRASELRSDWKTDRVVSPVAFAGGAVFLAAAGATAWFWSRRDSTRGALVVPLLSPTHVGLAASLNF